MWDHQEKVDLLGLKVILDSRDKRDIEGPLAYQEPKETEALWDHQVKGASEETWDLKGQKVFLDSKGKQET